MEDYANILYLSAHNPNVGLGKIFDKYMMDNNRYEDCNIDYYDRMRRVYVWYSWFRAFSFVEDYLLNRDDFISNNDLNDIEGEAIIYTNRNGITNKRIVQLIRNAFNHNDDSDFERMKLSVNGKYCEVEFRDIRTDNEKANGVAVRPFRMKFNVDYLMRLTRRINKEKLNALFVSFNIPDDFDILSNDLVKELDKVKFVHYYFPRKLPHDVVLQLNDLSKVSGDDIDEIKRKSALLHEFAKEQNHSVVEYQLTSEQKNKLISMIKQYKVNSLFGEQELKDNTNFYMYYLLRRIIPVPLLKHELFEQQVLIAGNYFLDTEIGYCGIIDRARNIVNGVIPENYDQIDTEIHNALLKKFETNASKARFLMDIIDGDFYTVFPIISYIDSVVTLYCKDDVIKIDGVSYEKEKLRNSFVHGRWYISSDTDIVMFDADPRNINDYNLEFVGKISIGKFKMWADSYMRNSSKGKVLSK